MYAQLKENDLKKCTNNEVKNDLISLLQGLPYFRLLGLLVLFGLF